MHSQQVVPAAGILILVLAASASAGVIEFVAPEDGAVVAGLTEFQFAVETGSGIVEIDVYVEGELVGTAVPPTWSFESAVPPGSGEKTITAIAFDASGGRVGDARIVTSGLLLEESLVVQAVQLYPVVTDRRGRYVRGLGKEAFTVLEEGRPVEIEYFSEDHDSLTLAVLLDASESMTKKLGLVSEAAAGLLDQLESADDVSVYAFNHRLLAGPRRSHDLDRARAFVRRLTAGGGTALYDAVADVLRDLEPVRGQKSIILFSDGRDNHSQKTLDSVVRQARASAATIYTVAAGESTEDKAARKDLRTLADETGGESFFVDNFRKVGEVFRSALADLRSQYAVGYTPPVGEAGLRRIEVRVSNPGLAVRAKRSYFYTARD